MSTKPEVKLGELLTTENGFRDAIHIAVCPVIAGTKLRPGQHVGIQDKDTNTVGTVQPFVGIVDPYLGRPIKEGERFYLCLYPQTITGLRHSWTHPAFADEDEAALRNWSIQATEKEFGHKEWLMEYAKSFNHYDDADTAFESLIDGLKSGELNRHGSYLYSAAEIPFSGDLQKHAEAYLGIKIDWDNFSFSCSC